MQAAIRNSRMAVVNQLIKLKRGGCRVWVVAHTIESNARAALKGAGIAMRPHQVHDKGFIVYAKFGSAYQYRVFTESHNLSGSAARRSDEILVKLAGDTAETHPVHDAYYTHFNDAYNAGRAL